MFNLSTKRFVLGALLLLMSLSTATAQEVRPITIPFTLNPNTGLIQVSCETESMPGKVQFCTIDTGAQVSLADPRAVSLGSLNGAPTVQIQTPAGTEFARKVQQKISVGGILTPVTLEVTSSIRRLDTDLIVGQDFFQQFSSVTIDYSNHTIALRPKN